MAPLINVLIQQVFNPLLKLMFGVGLMLFLFGIIEFLWDMTKGDHGEKGKQHMLWGLVGMFIIVSAYAIVRLLAGMICSGAPTVCYSS